MASSSDRFPVHVRSAVKSARFLEISLVGGTLKKCCKFQQHFFFIFFLHSSVTLLRLRELRNSSAILATLKIFD